ncbi:PsiF family protein [Frateuria aurantia]
MFLRTSIAMAALAVVTSAAFAAPASAKTLTPQQQRMATCAKESTGKKGAEHKAFMSSCLKGKTTASSIAAPEAAAAPAAKADVATATKSTSQRAKMTDCNAQAKTKALKGAERKAFMSTCLKG